MKEKIQDIGQVPAFYSTQVLKAERFYFDVHARGHQGITVVCGGCEHCEPDFRIDRKDFPYYSIEYVARGKGEVTLKDKTYPLVAGAVFAYGPDVPHIITTDPRDRLVKYFVDFSGTRALSLLTEYAPHPGHMVHTSSPTQILRLFEDLIANGQNVTRYSDAICATLLEVLMLKVAETAVSHDFVGSMAFATYQTCCEYIREHCVSLQTLTQIADACHMDEAYLCRLFKRFGELSPYKYLNRLKLNMAAMRMQAPDTPIKQIAYELGFSSPFHFSRAFKKAYGVSPDSFRRRR
ncbi:MAG: AraC family transcriptional regulator [Phycisphaerae bacterium]|nr:AraC family transcriptional regulator [Phycisphaerae bacterium]